MQLKTVIFMGRSGSGKGTQVKLLASEMMKRGVKTEDILNLSSGDLFRAFGTGTGFTQEKVLREVAAGHRLPDFIAVELWAQFFVSTYRTGTHLFLDGFPRSYGQALLFEDTLNFYERDPIDVLHLEVSEAWCVEHLMARKRADDTPESIKERLAFYENDVRAALDYYRNSPKMRFHEINGERTVEEIHADIVKALL